MKIRAKFRCEEVSKMRGFNGHEFVYSARLSPVTSGSDENKKFYAATPGGSLQLQSIVSDQFEPGEEYYLEITAASDSTA